MVLRFLAICILALPFISAKSALADSDTGVSAQVTHLLGAWEDASSWTSNCSFLSDERTDQMDRYGKHHFSLTTSKTFICKDGRFDVGIHRWNGIPSIHAVPTPEDGLLMRYIYRTQMTVAPLIAIVQYKHAKGHSPTQTIEVDPPDQADALRHLTGAMIDGYILSPDESTASYLHKHAQSVTHRQEVIEGNNLEALSAKTEYGQITIYLDPAHGMNLCRLSMHKGAGDTLRADNPVKLPFDIHDPKKRAPYGRVVSEDTTVSSVHFEKVQGIWISTQFSLHSVEAFADGINPCVVDVMFNRSEVDLSPDFEKAKAFEVNVPNGTQVFTGEEGLKHEWRDGSIVPSYDKTTVDGIDQQVKQIEGGKH